jgi:hypothetical protein
MINYSGTIPIRTLLGQNKVFILEGCPPLIHARTAPGERKGVLIRKGGLISVHVKTVLGERNV